MSAASKRQAGAMQVITANRLRDGVVIYLQVTGGQREWRENIREASIFSPAGAEASLAEAARDVRENRIIDPYAIAVNAEHAPQTQRETIRAGGPTIAYAG